MDGTRTPAPDLAGAASDSLLIPELAAPGGLSRGPAAVVLAGWLVLFLGGAAAVLDRRDT